MLSEQAAGIPANFRIGVATAGYQVEGGFNAPGQPANNWCQHEASGRGAVTGSGSNFWEYWPEDCARAAALGANAFRMGIEWARVQPRPEVSPAAPPAFDAAAFDRYAEILGHVARLGMEPLVTLFHWVHPAWAGADLWLRSDAVEELFVPYVRTTVRELGKRLVQRGLEPVAYFITINEPVVVPLATYLLGAFPRGGAKLGAANARQALDSLLLAHCRAYETVHEVYREEGWRRPVVTTNILAFCSYDIDRALVDLCLAGDAVTRFGDVPGLLAAERAVQGAVLRARVDNRSRWRWALDGAVARLLRWVLRDGSFPRFLSHIETHWPATYLDAVSLDYYDPFIGDYVDLNPPRVNRYPWEWRAVPGGLPAFLELYHRSARGRDIDILENGMAKRATEVGGGLHALPRGDGLRRRQALAAALHHCLVALDRGVRLRSYLYWSLIDNYEWGSFEPRFGLHGVCYADGARRMPTDAGGEEVASLFREAALALRAADRSRLEKVLGEACQGDGAPRRWRQ
ncbi:MAG: glycoside hydrolase family 1 protein [Candidatus Schekmanbacteria bacterium]|nr:glycoside hydrolase family 1 protein [Candidatus Schekmanbacteria bacterium]